MPVATSSWYSRLAASRLSRLMSMSLYAVRNRGARDVISSTASSVQSRRTRSRLGRASPWSAASGDMRHRPLPSDRLFESIHHLVHVLFGGDAPEAEPHRGMRTLVRSSHGLHHVGRLALLVGAGGSARHGHGA